MVDKERHVVRIGGGATWGQVAAALAPHDLAISSGDTKSVGVGGLTLTGGIGWKVRKYGLALDSWSPRRWSPPTARSSGRRGREPGAVLGGPRWRRQLRDRDRLRVRGPPDDRRLPRQDRLPGRGDGRSAAGLGGLLRTAPEELTAIAEFANPFAGGPEAPIEIHVVFDGDDPDLAAQAIDPIRRLGTVLADEVALKPYAATLVDGMTPPPGIQLSPEVRFVERESVADGSESWPRSAHRNGRRSSPSAASAVLSHGSPTTPPRMRIAKRT